MGKAGIADAAFTAVLGGVAQLFALVVPYEGVGLYDVDAKHVEEAQQLRDGEAKLGGEVSVIGSLVLGLCGVAAEVCAVVDLKITARLGDVFHEYRSFDSNVVMCTLYLMRTKKARQRPAKE